MMPQTTCFVFDLDDTLYAERDYVRSGFAAVDRLAAERTGIANFGVACWKRFLAGDRERIFDRVLQLHHGRVDPAVIRELVSAYRRHSPSIKLHPDARRFLGRARAAAAPLALLTDGPQESQRAKINALRLNSALSTIVVTAELGPGRSKPHPEAFQLVQQALGASGRFLYIADNPRKDFLTPNRLGWTSIRIQRPDGIYSQEDAPTPEHAPHFTVASLDEVWDLQEQQSPAVRQGFVSG